MIDCKSESTFILLKKDYDDFLLILVLSFIVVLYLEKNFAKALFKSFVALGTFLVLDMSCYHIGYIRGLLISLIIGTQLERIYQFTHYFIVGWLHKRKKIVNEILGKELTEIDDDIKDKPNKTK